ncbi:hypothetical protein N8935_08395 [Amylibacter sp.]|nr:hypothetical protein [Amylibacter sp.]
MGAKRARDARRDRKGAELSDPAWLQPYRYRSGFPDYWSSAPPVRSGVSEAHTPERAWPDYAIPTNYPAEWQGIYPSRSGSYPSPVSDTSALRALSDGR